MVSLQTPQAHQSNAMLKKLVIIAAIIGVPIAFFVANEYGQINEVSYYGAQSIVAATEGDQAPKVIIVSTIIDASAAPEEILCSDQHGAAFTVQYTGSAPSSPFARGQVLRFVGHMHHGGKPYFHATQVYGK